jgi:2-C-methyl-D-erythritol 4-phosphate cytidylyltransferase
MPKICAIVPAAGRGVRMGMEKPKQFLELSGRSILLHTLETIACADFISGIFVVVPQQFLSDTEALIDQYFHHSGKRAAPGSSGHFTAGSSFRSSPDGVSSEAIDLIPSISVVVGGPERQDSVFNALKRLPPDCEWVVVHDGVRPFVSLKLLEDVLAGASKTGAAIAALPASDTVKRAVDGLVLETLAREHVWLVQTPQIFRKDIIVRAYQEAYQHGWQCTDDASFVERMGIPVSVVIGESTNIKVTTPEDLAWASWFLESARGTGVHPAMVPSRKERL